MKPAVKLKKRIRRHKRVRSKVLGTAKRPRLSVFRSNKHVHLQIIDDERHATLLSASTREVTGKMNKTQRTQAAIELLSKRAKEAGVKQIVFDRGGYAYHGRVQVVAETARQAGLKI